MTTRSRQWMVLAAILGFSITLAVQSGCNTTEGVGRDLEKAGEKLQDAADDAKD